MIAMPDARRVALHRLRDRCASAIPLAALLTSFAAVAFAGGPGAWTPAKNWADPDGNGTNPSLVAIHMILTRGDNAPYHSRLLWFSGESGNTLYGGEWGWRPGSDGCGVFPGTNNFTALTLNRSEMDIFCAGHTQAFGDGRIMFSGGTGASTLRYGERHARIYTPGTTTQPSTWTTPSDMSQYRWYPSTVELETGRGMALSGNQHPHHRVFFGRTSLSSPPSTPSGDLLHRFAPIVSTSGSGFWEPTVTPAADPSTGQRPAVRERHTSAEMALVKDFEGHIYFGGLGPDGLPRDDTWILKRNPNYTGADYTYTWNQKSLASPPPKRSEHTAVSATGSKMVVYGGRDQFNNFRPGVWRLYSTGVTGLAWALMDITTPTGLVVPDRYGHAAYYEKITLDPSGSPTDKQRMVVFGGVTAAGQAPSDASVYVLTFDPTNQNSATWSKPTVVDIQPGVPDPAPRCNHTLVPDGRLMLVENLGVGLDGRKGNVAYMFGGALGGTSYSNELWLLWTFEDGTIGWERRDFASAPSARARHAATFDPSQGLGTDQFDRGRLYIFGGENATSLADRFTYVIDPWRTASPSPPSWESWAEASTGLTGHTMVREKVFEEITFARVPEVYDAGTNNWQAHTGATLLQEQYPPAFLAPHSGTGSRVLSIGQDRNTYWLDVPASGSAGAWQLFQGGNLGFDVSSAVRYLPGKVLATGGADGVSGGGTTKFLFMTSTDESWRNALPMVPRSFHNLVLLPSGQVLAVGGVNSTQDSDLSKPVKRPQLYTLNSQGGLGTWSDTLSTSALARQGKARNYHSTAILLPDGRVVSAGGHEPNGPTPPRDEHFAEIYCPPYLFTTGTNLAPRPSITDAVSHVRYGRKFSVCVSSGNPVTSACLMRPAASTHGFDQGQLYIPLPLEGGIFDPGYISVSGPADSSVAPPGDYMLFVLDNAGVPAVSKWVRVGSVLSSSDAVAPSPIDPNGLYAEFISDHSIVYTWTATGDDDGAGVASQYDLRYSTSIITSSNFASRLLAPNNPAPACPGGFQTYELTGLQSCTNYDLGIKVADEIPNRSALTTTGFVRTACWGGGGGGFSATRVSGAEGASSEATVPARTLRFSAASNAALPGATGARLVAEFANENAPAWTIRLVSASDDTSLRALPAGVVLVQDANGLGGWRTRLAVTPTAGLLGVRSLARSGRVIFPAGVQIETVELDPLRFACTEARHSGVGNLSPDSVLAGAVGLAAGDVVTLRYATRTTEGTGQDCFFSVRIPAEALAATSLRPKLSEPPVPATREFALRVARPNPFTSGTQIPFSLATGSVVRLEIFDASESRGAQDRAASVAARARRGSRWTLPPALLKVCA